MSADDWDDKVSSVEMYRKGQLKSPPYDMADPLEVAIFGALQAYVDLLERLDIARQDDKREVNLYDYEDTRVLNLRAPGFLEAELFKLKDWSDGELELVQEDRFAAATSLLEAFFSPAKNLAGKLVPWGYGDYQVDRPLWEAGEEILEGEREQGGG